MALLFVEDQILSNLEQPNERSLFIKQNIHFATKM